MHSGNPGACPSQRLHLAAPKGPRVQAAAHQHDLARLLLELHVHRVDGAEQLLVQEGRGSVMEPI